MELTGTLITIGQVITFDSGFKKREFIIETPGEYKQKVKFELFKDKADSFSHKEGEELKVLFDIRGTEWNDKVYNNLVAWKVEVVSGSKPVDLQEDESSLPF